MSGSIGCGPFGAAGAVFEGDADGGEAVADGVGGGEVFGGAGVGAELDQELHEAVGGCRRPLKRTRRGLSGGGPFGAAGAVFEHDAGWGEAVADFVGDGEVFVLRALARSSMTRGMTLARRSSPDLLKLARRGLRKMPRMLASSLSVVSSAVNLATAAASVLPLFSRSASSQNLLVIVARSKSSPMAPPVLKSSSMAAMNFRGTWRRTRCRIESLLVAEAAGSPEAVAGCWRT